MDFRYMFTGLLAFIHPGGDGNAAGTAMRSAYMNEAECFQIEVAKGLFWGKNCMKTIIYIVGGLFFGLGSRILIIMDYTWLFLSYYSKI